MFTALLSIAQKLASIDKKCYAVGSFCVNKIRGMEHEGDIDLATDATPEEITSVLKVAGEIGKKYGTLIIREGGISFEITTFRKDFGSVNHRKPISVTFSRSIEEDAMRRDFTINAIYYDILADSYIDPVGGIDDLNKKIIRFVGDMSARLNEDILRLIRYVRFRYSYGFAPANKTYDNTIRERISELQDIAIERIKQEFDKILLLPEAPKALEYLKKIGFLKLFLAEVDVLSETEGGPAHHLEGNVWKHTLLVIKATKKTTTNFSPENILLLRWAALLHDIGKAQTMSKDASGCVHYYDHERIGAEMIADVARRWKLSTRESKAITWLIRHHLLPQKFFELRRFKANKLMMEPLFDLLCQLCIADGTGKKPKYHLPYKKIMQRYAAFQKSLKEAIFFTGEDIQDRYPVIQGKAIGERLSELNNQILARL